MRALLLAAGLCLGWTARAADPVPERPRPHVWVVPRPLQALDVPGRTQALGMPVSIHAVRSAESVPVLEAHFRRQFQEAGLFLPPRAHVAPVSSEVQVTGLDPDTFIAYTVFLQPNPDGSTTVLLTEAFLGERRREAPQDAFVPLMPGARDVMQSRTENTSLVQYSVKASREEARGFHTRTLTGAGYREVEPGVFVRGAERLRVSVQTLREGEVGVVVLRMPDVTGAGGLGGGAGAPGPRSP
jgi:hypothetical protein